MGARKRLLSIYIHLSSPLSRGWASPLKEQLLVSGQPQEFSPPSAHTSGSRCCNHESQGFVFMCLTQSASRRSSVEREACSLCWWTWTPRMWVRSAQGHDQRFQTETKAIGHGANTLGRRDDIIPFFFFSGANIAPTRISVAWTGKDWFLFIFIILLLCVCTYMPECIPHMHVYVWGQLVKLVLFFHVVTGDQPRDDQAWGQAPLPTKFYCQLIYFHLNFLSLSTKRFHVDWYIYPQWTFWSQRVIKGRCPSAISCNVTKVFEWRS